MQFEKLTTSKFNILSDKKLIISTPVIVFIAFIFYRISHGASSSNDSVSGMILDVRIFFLIFFIISFSREYK